MTTAKTLSTPTLHWARIGRARRFIRDHAAEPLTLDLIAAEAAPSPYHFAHIFRALTGETVFTHVSRVRLRDSELSGRVRAHFGITFDPADVPHEAFLVAGEAWRRVRAGTLDPTTCGVSSIRVLGEGFVAASVARDLAALNKREMLAWDVWGLSLGLPPGAPVPEAAARRLDAVAALTAAPNLDWPAVRDAHDRDDGFRVPAVVTGFGPAGPARVAVELEPDPDRPATT